MNILGFPFKSDFARRYVAEGKAEGWVAGRMELVLEILARRFGPLSKRIETRIRCASDTQLGAVADQMLKEQTLEEGLKAARDSLKHEIGSDFARRYYVRGKSEGLIKGKTNGRRELMQKLLAARFGPLPDWTLSCIRTQDDEELDKIVERFLEAKTLEEAIDGVSLKSLY